MKSRFKKSNVAVGFFLKRKKCSNSANENYFSLNFNVTNLIIELSHQRRTTEVTKEFLLLFYKRGEILFLEFWKLNWIAQ